MKIIYLLGFMIGRIRLCWHRGLRDGQSPPAPSFMIKMKTTPATANPEQFYHPTGG